MAGPIRRRGHAAASARILTAGLSSAAAFGMVAGMAVSARGPESGEPESAAASTAELEAAPGPVVDSTAAAAPSEVVVVIRRHWIPTPSDARPAPAAPAPRLVTAPGRPATAGSPSTSTATPAPARTVAPQPKPRPVTRTRGS